MSQYTTVREPDNEAIADLIKQRLDEAGIPCVVVPTDLAASAGAHASSALNVPAEKVDEATELLGGCQPRAPGRSARGAPRNDLAR